MREAIKLVIISIIIQNLIFAPFAFSGGGDTPGRITEESYTKQLDKFFRLDDTKIPEQFRYLYLLRYLAVKDLLKSRVALHKLIGNRDGFNFALGDSFTFSFGGKYQPDIAALIDKINEYQKPMSESEYNEFLTLIVNISLNITAYDKAINFLTKEFWEDEKIEASMNKSTEKCQVMDAGFQGRYNVCHSDFKTNPEKYVEKYHGEKIREFAQIREYLFNILGRFLATKLNGTLFDEGDDLYKLIYKEAWSLGYFPSADEPLKPVSDDFNKALNVVPAFYDPNPNKADTDNDGLLDGQEDQNGDGVYSRDGDDGFNYTDDDETDPLTAKTNDIYPFNDFVYRHGTNEYMPVCFSRGEADCTDSDRDGLPNFVERELGTRLYVKDTDQDGILDGGDKEPTRFNQKRYSDVDQDGIPDNFFGKITYATNRLYSSAADTETLFRRIKPLVEKSLLSALEANNNAIQRLINVRAITSSTDTTEIDKLVYFTNLTQKAEEIYGKEFPFIFRAESEVKKRVEQKYSNSDIRRWTLNILAGLSLGAAIYFSGGTALLFLGSSGALFTANSGIDYGNSSNESALISDFYIASTEMSNYAQYQYSKEDKEGAVKSFALDIGLSVFLFGPLNGMTKFRIIPNTTKNAARVAEAGSKSKPILGGALLKVEGESFSLSRSLKQLKTSRFSKSPFGARLAGRIVGLVERAEARAKALAELKKAKEVHAIERGTRAAAQLEKIPVIGRSISRVGGEIVTSISDPGFKKYIIRTNVLGVGYMAFVDYATMGSNFYEKKEDVFIDCALEVYLLSGFAILGAAVPMLNPAAMAKLSTKEKLFSSLKTFKRRVPWGIGIGLSGAGFAQGTAVLKDRMSGDDGSDVSAKDRLGRLGYDAAFLAFSSNVRYQAQFFLTKQLPEQYPALKHFIFDVQLANEMFGNWHYAKLLDVSGLRFNDISQSDYSIGYPELHVDNLLSDKSKVNLQTLIRIANDNYRGEKTQINNIQEFQLDPRDRDILVQKMYIDETTIDLAWDGALVKAESVKNTLSIDDLKLFIHQAFRDNLCRTAHLNPDLNYFCSLY